MLQKPSFDDIFMSLSVQLAQRSHCIKVKVGAVLTKDTRIISIGYNGPPAGSYNCDELWPVTGCPRSHTGGCALSVHAEQNALFYALSNCVNVKGSLLYVTLAPCLPCARIILTAGIKKVIYMDSYSAYKNLDREYGLDFLREFDVTVEQYVLPMQGKLA